MGASDWWMAWAASAIIALSAMLPAHVVVLIVVIPLAVLSEQAGVLPPLLSVGPADLQLYDLALLVLTLRVLLRFASGRRTLFVPGLYLPVAAYLAWGLATSLMAFFHLSPEIGRGEIFHWLRFVLQASGLVLIVQDQDPDDARRPERVLDFVGWAVAASVLASFTLHLAGVSFGEVQAREETRRVFGPLGDPVAFLLALFLVWNFLRGSIAGVWVQGGALLATGGRGALLTVAVAVIALLCAVPRDRRPSWRRMLGSLAGIAAIVAVVVAIDLGAVRTRAFGSAADVNLRQRLAVAETGARVFLDHPATGVGYKGFRYVSASYGIEEKLVAALGDYPAHLGSSTGNQYVEVAVDGGVPGLILFLWMCGTMAVVLRRVGLRSGDPLYWAAWAWLLGLLIGNQFSVWMAPGSLISHVLWVVLALAIRRERAARSGT